MSEEEMVAWLTPAYERQYQAGVARRVRFVWLRCVERRTYRSIAGEAGITPARVSDIVAASLTKIRRTVGERGRHDPGLRERLRASLPAALVFDIFGAA